jgi:hypothetical protein
MSDWNPPLPPPPYPPAPVVAPYGMPVPLSFGQILDRIFRLLRANVWPFLGIGFLPIGFIVLFEGLFFGALALAGVFKHPFANQNPIALLWEVIPFYLVLLVAIYFIYGLYHGAATYAALQADLGFKVTTGEALRHGWSRVGRYSWLMILQSLIVTLPIVVLVAAGAAIAAMMGLFQNQTPNPGALFLLIPLGILCYMGFLVYAVLMMLRLSLAYPACVHEGITAGQAIKRSGVLTNGAKGRIFLASLIIYAIGSAFFMVLYMIGMVIFAVAAMTGAAQIHGATPLAIGLAVVFAIVMLALVFAWAALQMGAYSAALAIFYRDQCLRKDGLGGVPAQ